MEQPMYASEQQTGQQPSYRSAQQSNEAGAYRGSPAAGSWPSRPTPSMGGAHLDGYPSGAYGASGAQSGRPQFSAGTVSGGMFERTGLLGWWLRLTAPAWPAELPPIDERERLRKAELTGLSVLAVALLLATLLSASLARPQAAIWALVAGAGLITAAALNRSGWTRTAAYLVPTILMVVVIGGILWEDGGLQLATVPAYDLFVLPIFFTSLIGDRRAPWAFATIAMAFILCDVLLQPHALITSGTATAFDDMQYTMNVRGWWGLVGGPLALAFFAALFGWLGALSVESAITRADRAEEIAALEHQAAQQRRQLEHGVRQILQTHVRLANGDFTARAPLGHDNVLWQIGSSLNNLIARMQRTAQAEQALARTEAELRRVAAALDEAEAGGQPRWPSPSGTAADLVLVRVARHAVREPLTPVLSFASDGGSQPTQQPIHEPARELAMGWRASSLVDPDACRFTTNGPAGMRLTQVPIHTPTQSPAQTSAQAPIPTVGIVTPPIAAAGLSASQPLPAAPRAPRSTTPTLPGIQAPTAELAAASAPVPGSAQAPSAPTFGGAQSVRPFNPDLWPTWLAESGARLTGAPQVVLARMTAASAPAADAQALTSTGEFGALPTSAQGRPDPPPVATAVPDQSLADAAHVPWRSETHRRRAQFLGPVPNPPWMDPTGQ
jgi:hypothetical protein